MLMSSAELYINLANICSNWNALNSLSNGAAGAVVKANAYGLGIKEVGISLAKAGARDFFVAVAEEGAALRRAIGPGPKIYIFSGHMVGDTTLLRDFHLIPLINSGQATIISFRKFIQSVDWNSIRYGNEPPWNGSYRVSRIKRDYF
jgi:alanine racemase